MPQQHGWRVAAIGRGSSSRATAASVASLENVLYKYDTTVTTHRGGRGTAGRGIACKQTEEQLLQQSQRYVVQCQRRAAGRAAAACFYIDKASGIGQPSSRHGAKRGGLSFIFIRSACPLTDRALFHTHTQHIW